MFVYTSSILLLQSLYSDADDTLHQIIDLFDIQITR